MIARLTVAVPFTLTVVEGAVYTGYVYEDDGYLIAARPPVRSAEPLPPHAPTEVTLDDNKAFLANALQFDFQKDSFDRRRGGTVEDPPVALLQRVLDDFVSRLRYVTRAAHIAPVNLLQTTWRLQYLSDDETELPEDPALFRARIGHSKSWAFANVPPAVWSAIHELPPGEGTPPWDGMLLDAFDALPAVGTALVLGAAALEVFIDKVLERAAIDSDVPVDIWHWLNDRDNWLKDPSTDERFDILLRHFVGHSLKEQPILWQAFKESRYARNAFVHGGRAELHKKEVSASKARELLTQLVSIIKTVREWLPKDQRWAYYEIPTSLSATLPLLPTPPAS